MVIVGLLSARFAGRLLGLLTTYGVNTRSLLDEGDRRKSSIGNVSFVVVDLATWGTLLNGFSPDHTLLASYIS